MNSLYEVQAMKKTVEIRWHGRGGQGAKTAALLLADVAFKTGRCVQGFPEYGPERMGAPITAFNRISEDQIRVHSNIYDPDYVVVVDETLLHSVHVTDGLKEDGAIIVNTPRSPKEVRSLLRGYQGRVFTVDARRISEETLGRNFPNTPMLAATAAVCGVMNRKEFLGEMESSFAHKFAKKPEVIKGNMAALEMAYDQVEKDMAKTNVSPVDQKATAKQMKQSA
jgi:pyruvate ferredoxin oxidoreductase gamma subunit